MNVVLIVPTGIGAEIGGHAGDACPVARLIASACDTLITHPNVVNASDINEMTENTLYVEGSMLDRFLEGWIELKSVRSNKVLVVTNAPLKNEVVNSVSAARTSMGLDASIMVLKTPLRLIGRIEGNRAVGDVIGWRRLVTQVKEVDFDALAITTPIEVEREIKFKYFRNGGINPWGGVEAEASKLISIALDKPVAHSPAEDILVIQDKELYEFNEVVDPRIAAEVVSISYLHCILKGLHKAPRIGKGLSVRDVDCLVTPVGCVGRPHYACLKAGIPIIAVKENKTCLNDRMPEEFILVENYLEAVGIITAIKAGVHPASVRRPIAYTKVVNGA